MGLKRRRLLLPEMEGAMARWYDKQRGTASNRKAYREQAQRFVDGLPAGAAVLEVAPGPGYLAIEIARLGFRVTGLDISRTMVEIATGHAREEGIDVDFRLGDVSDMPFEPASFDFIVCQAAFKNFRQPVPALDEMYRVLRPGGMAVIEDLRKDATRRDVAYEVKQQGLQGPSAIITKVILGGLRRRAYRSEQFQRLARESAFGTADIRVEAIGVEMRLRKTAIVTKEGAKQ